MNKAKLEVREVMIPVKRRVLILEIDLDVLFSKTERYVLDKPYILSNEISYVINGHSSLSKNNVVKSLLKDIAEALNNIELPEDESK